MPDTTQNEKAKWLENFFEKYKPQYMFDVRKNIRSEPDLNETMFSETFDKFKDLVKASTLRPEIFCYTMLMLGDMLSKERNFNPCPQPDPLTT